MIRLLLVDDHPLVRDGLKLRLANEPDIEVVGEAGDATSSTNTPRRVSSFINRVMILCNTACSAASIGAGTSTKRSFSED